MTLIVSSKRMKVTNALRNFISKHSQKLSKFGEKSATKVSVYLETVAKKRNDPTANIVTYTISMPGKKMLVVKKKAKDMYKAIIEASSEAVRKMRKIREKRIDRQRVVVR